jgi:hypothetical protein
MAKVTFPAGYVTVEPKQRGAEPRDIGALFADMKEPGDGFILPELTDENGKEKAGFKNKPQLSGALGKQIIEYATANKIPIKWDAKYNALKKDWRVMVTRTIAPKTETAKA